MHTFQLKLKEMKDKLKKWNEEEFGNILEEKKRLEQRMEELQMDILEGIQEDRTKEERSILNQLEERRKQEETLIDWLITLEDKSAQENDLY